MARLYPNLDLASAWMRYALAYSQMSMAAAEVIFRRSLRISQGAMTGPEAVGMVLEKASAFAAATEKAAAAAARGSHPAGIATAALRPIRAKTRSNVRKLRR
jgi:hypothetical protein